MTRPMPPEHLLGGLGQFDPDPDLWRWVRRTLIVDGASLQNEDHEHLQRANIGFLWTNEPNEKRGRMILGTCQLMPPTGDKWLTARTAQQIAEWFGDMPDFLITLYAPAAAEMDDASFLALVEHELSHAGQKVDAFGSPCFDKQTGEPLWTIVPHSVEEFTGVVARYGAWSPQLKAMADALASGPQVAAAQINIACGSCLTK